jgi:hypothetical protein
MRDIQEDKVHRIYLDIQKEVLEAPTGGAHREFDFLNNLEDAIRSHFAASRRIILARPTEEQTTTENYSRILFEDFQQWNEHYKNDRDTQFAIDEINFLGNKIVEFLKTGLPELPEWARNDPPDWMSELCTLLAFCAAKDAFDREGEFRNRASWERACGRAFEAISPYVDGEDQERIFQMFQLTYPLTGTFQENRGRFVRARRGGEYNATEIHFDEHQDPKKNENNDDTESKVE